MSCPSGKADTGAKEYESNERQATYSWTLSCSRLNKGKMRTWREAQGLSPERDALILGAEAGAMLRVREEGVADKLREGGGS